MDGKKAGWIISLWTDAFQINLNNRDSLPYLSWSPYDRVTIDEVNDFSNFFKVNTSLNWNGAVQYIHLVPIGECVWKLGDNSLITVPGSKKDYYGIYCVVTARFKEQVKDVTDVGQKVNKKISEYLEDKNVLWQGFNSLGPEDFAGIFLAGNIADLSEVIEFIKQISYTNSYDGNSENKLFNSIYSFLGMNNSRFEQEPKANLLVRLYLKPGCIKNEIYNKLNSELERIFDDKFSIRDVISGKGCLEVEIENHMKIFSCFYNNKEAIFNGQSDFYSKYIENSRTYCLVLQHGVSNVYSENIGEIDICKENNFINNISGISGIHPISRFILKEHQRMINSKRCLWWRNILQRQYEVYFKFVKKYTEDKNETAICTLNNKVQTVLLHINQATAPIYELPYHNYYYSGSYNDILKMYYGMIASVFNIAYKLPRSEESIQYDIAYCVDFEAAIRVHSSMYNLNNDTERFVIFHLPYEAFMKFDKTVKLLLHEVFHYVAPFDRKDRNFILVKILAIRVFEQYIDYLKENGLTQQNEKEIVDYFYKNFGKLSKIIYDNLDEEFYSLILNEFTIVIKNNKLKQLPEGICKIICEEVNNNLGLWLGEVRGYCTYKEVYPKLFASTSARYKYMMESIRRIALAEKEAFCDLNMIYMLDLPLDEYIELLYDSFFGKYDNDKVKEQLKNLVNRRDVSIGSFELRLGMVLNYYLNQQYNEEPVKYKEAFNKEIDRIISEGKCISNEFYKYLGNLYEHYLSIYTDEFSLHKEFFSKEKQWFNSFKKNEYNQEKLRKATSCHGQIDENISVIRSFKDVKIEKNNNIKNKVKSTSRFKDITLKLYEKRIEVRSLGEYVEECCNIIQNWKNDMAWFRGVCNNKYLLTPSIFRYIDPELSLYANQAKYLKEAYYATISDVSLWTVQLKGVLEHMGFLQHYGMPTTLLDFSDDMLTALHFALNPDSPGDLEKVDNYILQPKVVLFNPAIYNDAVISLKKGRPARQPGNISPILLYVQDNQLLDFYVHNMSNEYLRNHSRDHTEDYSPNPRTNLYPQPIAIRRSNARIQAQNGTFVAYNLSANPEKNGKVKEEYYSYLALERIQNEYLKLLKDNNKSLEDGKFIKEIYINKMAVPAIKKQLKVMHVTTAKAYPELFRIFNEYMDKLKKQ